MLLGEGEIGVGGVGRQLDGLFELALGVGEAALTPEDVGEREMGRRVAGLERDRVVAASPPDSVTVRTSPCRLYENSTRSLPPVESVNHVFELLKK